MDKTEAKSNFRLRSRFSVACTISTSNNFRVWEGKSNNGIALLVLGWAYILSASLAERQQLSVRYASLDGPSGSVEIHLDYASAQDGWTVAGDGLLPWAVLVDNLDLEIAGDIDSIHIPPTESHALRDSVPPLTWAINALQRWPQLSVSRSTAVRTSPQKPAGIELPRPLLLTHIASPGQRHNPIDFKFLGRYMTLSLDPNYFGSAMWSIFGSRISRVILLVLGLGLSMIFCALLS